VIAAPDIEALKRIFETAKTCVVNHPRAVVGVDLKVLVELCDLALKQLAEKKP